MVEGPLKNQVWEGPHGRLGGFRVTEGSGSRASRQAGLARRAEVSTIAAENKLLSRTDYFFMESSGLKYNSIPSSETRFRNHACRVGLPA